MLSHRFLAILNTYFVVAPLLQRECLPPKAPHACQEFRVFLRRCWSPLPSLGGALCSDKDLPVIFGQPCPNGTCSSPELNMPIRGSTQISCLNSATDPINSCSFISTEGKLMPDDFKPCCSSNFNGTGLCLAGRCIRKLAS